MPHFGLIDEHKYGPVESLLMRARLHIRCGRRRVGENGKISLGILTLYDALNSALQWYIQVPENEHLARQNPDRDFRDDRTIYIFLQELGIIDNSLEYDALNEIVDNALKEELAGYDCVSLLDGLQNVMTQLGVMPFDEAALPPEDPATV